MGDGLTMLGFIQAMKDGDALAIMKRDGRYEIVSRYADGLQVTGKGATVDEAWDHETELDYGEAV